MPYAGSVVVLATIVRKDPKLYLVTHSRIAKLMLYNSYNVELIFVQCYQILKAQLFPNDLDRRCVAGNGR